VETELVGLSLGVDGGSLGLVLCVLSGLGSEASELLGLVDESLRVRRGGSGLAGEDLLLEPDGEKVLTPSAVGDDALLGEGRSGGGGEDGGVENGGEVAVEEEKKRGYISTERDDKQGKWETYFMAEGRALVAAMTRFCRP
jgi:hypothetical protein